jgi:hypothetical protein
MTNSPENNYSSKKRKLTEDEANQSSLNLAINKPFIYGFLKTYMIIPQKGELIEENFRKLTNFMNGSPKFLENEEILEY